MIRSESRRNLRPVVDIMLKSPKRGWFAAVLIAYVVNGVPIDGEPVYLGQFKLIPKTFVKAKDADVIRWPRM
jgi:hypothetical protein